MFCSACKDAPDIAQCTVPGQKQSLRAFLHKHLKGPRHKEAVAQLVHGTSAAELRLRHAPSVQAFRDALARTRAPNPSHVAGAILDGKRIKRRKWLKMLLANGEGKRKLERQFLSDASFITLHPDTKGKRLTIFYAAASRKLETRYGVLGQVNAVKVGKGALGLQKGIKIALRTPAALLR